MKAYVIAMLLLLGAIPLSAQNPQPKDNEKEEEAEAPKNTEDEENQKRRWIANLPSGKYAVNLGNITSISEHSYLLNGNLMVTEVTVDTTGASLVRFYYLEPITDSSTLNIVDRIKNRSSGLKDRTRDRTGISVDEMVQKTYPDTTHARTVEFRLLSRGELKALYGSVYTAWDTGKGRTFNVK